MVYDEPDIAGFKVEVKREQWTLVEEEVHVVLFKDENLSALLQSDGDIVYSVNHIESRVRATLDQNPDVKDAGFVFFKLLADDVLLHMFQFDFENI